MRVADAPFLMGGILVVAGLLIIFFQFRGVPSPRERLSGAAYPGAVFIGVGMVLMVLGAFARYIW